MRREGSILQRKSAQFPVINNTVWRAKSGYAFNYESSFMVAMEETLLDPAFWQALGHALGWSEACDLFITCVHGEEECRACRGYYWMYQWHCFIQEMANGHTPEAFFESLSFPEDTYQEV